MKEFFNPLKRNVKKSKPPLVSLKIFLTPSPLDHPPTAGSKMTNPLGANSISGWPLIEGKLYHKIQYFSLR